MGCVYALVAAGLSLIFGVTRIINIAHGSLYMVGIYLAYTFATRIGGGLGFWGGIVAAALIVAVIGAFIMSVLINGLRIMSVAQEWQMVLTGLIIILAVYTDILRRGKS